MRRIPRPLRAIDPSHPFSSSVRQRISPLPCRSSAAFSTTPSCSFLLPAGKQDKKKHQQFVRRWQKRLLGESEPIGAHVDPYDPTSPVRIAPEDQGEYEEVLDEDRPRSNVSLYKPAQKSDGLLRVGGEQWVQQKLEGDMAKEFEKLTLRTYTPLTLGMADEIEELTGTPYTLKDENLMMAQTVHEVTGRPYTDYNFGLHRKVTTSSELRNRFAQAVAEVYALKEAGLDMDMSKFANRGVYDPPRWVKDITLYRTESGELALAFPKYKSAEQFLELMQTAPAWESSLAAEQGELLVEEAADLLEPVMSQEQMPTMDPDTPAFKRAAVVKADADKKPFDFMSNRPVPRAKPVETTPVETTPVEAKVEEVIQTQEPELVEVAPAPSSLPESTSAAESSRSATSPPSHPVREDSAQHSGNDIRASGNAAQQTQPESSVTKGEEVKWRHVRITDVAVKFALFKRLLQLTGARIPDPQLSSANTLGDLYGYLCDAARPQPASLFSAIHVEGQKAREKAKQQIESDATSRKRADLGDLINLGNVELRRVKPTKTEKRTKTGLDKVVQYALWERGLGRGRAPRPVQRGQKQAPILEGTRTAPEFGRPISSKGANFLSRKTKDWMEEQERQSRASAVE